MAEVLGVVSSISAILQLASTAVRYIKDVKNAPDDEAKLSNEICAAHGILVMLKDRVEQQPNTTLSTVGLLACPNGPLSQFQAALERLIKRLKPASGMKAAGKTLAWPFKKAEVEEILRTIERQKSCFSLAFQEDHV